MKNYRLLSVLTLVALAGCSHFTPDDRAMLSSTNQTAHEAKAEAQAAHMEAKEASDKADRMFRVAQNK